MRTKAVRRATRNESATGTAPKVATVGGVTVVTIPIADYEDFLECRRFRDAHRKRAARYAPAPCSPIDRDPEVAAFLAERFGKMSLEDIVKECQQQFGPERTPSRASAGRYWQRLRVELGGAE